MRKLIVTDAAKADINAIAEFVADQSGSKDIADGLIEKLVARCIRLADLPGSLGTARPELSAGLRSVPQGEYIIFFRYSGSDAIEIVNILNGRVDVIAYSGKARNPR